MPGVGYLLVKAGWSTVFEKFGNCCAGLDDHVKEHKGCGKWYLILTSMMRAGPNLDMLA